MTREENDNVPEILFSQKTKKQFRRVIGFDLGSSGLCCSLSNDKNPASASVFRHWVHGSKATSIYPTCMQYKNWAPGDSNHVKVGFEANPKESPIDNCDVGIPSVKTYVIQHIKEGAKENEPDASLVLADFFKAVCAIFEREFTIGALQSCSLAEYRFCFGVPDGLDGNLEYTKLIREAFRQAGFLNEHDDDNRLIFVNDAVAAGYNCLATPRIFSGFEQNKNYLVADIGYYSVKLSVIKAQTTEAASFVVSSISNETAGYRSLSDNLRNYLTERYEPLGLDITNPQQINKVVASFEKYQKMKIDLEKDNVTTTFKGTSRPVKISNADLRELIFKPFLDDIFKLVYSQYQTNAVKQIIFRGKYCNDRSFYQRCKDFDIELKAILPVQNVPDCIIWEEKAEFMVCQGAVSFGLRSISPRIPSLLSQQTLEIKVKDIQTFATNQESTEANAAPAVIPKGHYVVGIDFGTTFSGCSYADISTEDPNNPHKIIVMDDWSKAYSYPKAATALRYNDYKNRFMDLWGYKALETQPNKNELNLEFFKLLLSPANVERIYGKGNREIQDITDRLFMFNVDSQDKKKRDHTKALTPVKIIAKYLYHMNCKIKKTLEAESKLSEKDLKIYYVLTVPAMWTETGRSTMIEAAIEAQLVKRGEERALQLITEPEAAALACEDFMNKTFKLPDDSYKKELNFIAFDAGGGTVDLVTFRKSKDSIQQLGDGTGGTCGGSQLDKNFRELIVTFYYHVMGVNVSEAFYKHHMDYFAKEIKDDFMATYRPRSEYKIMLPFKTNIPGDAEPMEYPGFESSCTLTDDKKAFIISQNDIKRFVFDPVIDQVLELLKRHIDKCAQFLVSSVLLIGGFSQSKYLQKRVKAFCAENNISHVGIPDEGVTAVSRGAVSYFLNPRLVSQKAAALSYAIQVDLPDKDTGKNHLSYFIRKGTPIEVEETWYQQTVSVNYPESAVIALFSRDDKEMPDQTTRTEPFESTYQNEIKKIAEYIIDLPENSTVEIGTPIQLEVSFKITVEGVSLGIKSLDSLINIEHAGQVDVASCITFERIKPDFLMIHLNAEKVRNFNIFSLLLPSRTR